MNPIVEIAIINGYIKLREAKGILPTKFETNNPSTILYIDVKIIIIIDGIV
jgi:hypothetical protein